LLIEQIVNNFSIKSNSIKFIVGSTLSAILVSLGIILFAKILSFTIHPGIAASFGTITAAIFGIKSYKKD
jgi:uncharacterized membrane protein